MHLQRRHARTPTVLAVSPETTSDLWGMQVARETERDRQIETGRETVK
jgi:G:T-mismatch repair DNA endonuclease (very short patch repair protein)